MHASVGPMDKFGLRAGKTANQVPLKILVDGKSYGAAPTHATCCHSFPVCFELPCWTLVVSCVADARPKDCCAFFFALCKVESSGASTAPMLLLWNPLSSALRG